MPDERRKKELPALPPLPALPGKAAVPPLPSRPGAGPPKLPPLPSVPGPVPGAPPLPVSARPSAAPWTGESGGATPTVIPIIVQIPVPAAPPPSPPAPVPPAPPDVGRASADRRIEELESRFGMERERVLWASLVSKEAGSVMSRLDASLQDVRERLRLDRREEDQEAARGVLQSRLQELEAQLGTTRDFLVSSLRERKQEVELREKEITQDFTRRLREMEQAWEGRRSELEKSIQQREAELQDARALIERLAGVERENLRLLQEKQFAEQNLQKALEEKTALHARAAPIGDLEREVRSLRGEVESARAQLQDAAQRHERELHSLEAGFREREARLQTMVEQLREDAKTLTQRLRAEHDAEVQRLRDGAEAELNRALAQADLNEAALQKLRGAAGALERRLAALRPQAQEILTLREELQRQAGRHAKELQALQQGFREREAAVLAEAEKQFERKLEAVRIEERMLSMQLEAEYCDEVRRLELEAREARDKEADLRRKVEAEAAERARAAQAFASEAEQSRHVLEERIRVLAREKESLGKELLGLSAELQAAAAKRAAEAAAHAGELAANEQAVGELEAQLKRSSEAAASEQSRLRKELAALQERLEQTTRKAQAQLEGDKRRIQDALEGLAASQRACEGLKETLASVRAEKRRAEETFAQEKRRLEGVIAETNRPLEEALQAARDEARRRTEELGDLRVAHEKLQRKLELAQSEMEGRLQAMELRALDPPTEE